MPPREFAEAAAQARVAVVIPTWNGHDRVRSCLASLGDPAIAEVVVVDNGSAPENARELYAIAREANARVLRLDQNRGFAAACNVGIRSTSSPYICVLNDDTRCASRTISSLLRATRVAPRIAFSAPRSNYVKGRQLLEASTIDRAGIEASDVEGMQRFTRGAARGLIEDVEHLAGLCLLARRETWEELDGFDERYGIGNFEDDDLCLRARRRGERIVVVHDSYVWHEGNATFRRIGVDYDEQMRAQRAIYEAKWEHDALALAELASSRDEPLTQEMLRALRGLTGRDRAWGAAILARQAQLAGDAHAALDEWTRVLCVAPLHREARCSTSLAMLQLGDIAGSEALLDAILGDFGLDPIALASLHTQRARCFLDRGRDGIASAEEELRRAFALHADFVPAHHLRGILALEQGRADDARCILEDILDDRDADMLSNLGIARYRCGDVSGAIDAFEAGACIAGPDSVAAQNLRALGAVTTPHA